MLIKALRFKDHPQIGDLSLDFTGPGGAAYPIVVIAGANGTGKSLILEATSAVLEGGGSKFDIEADVILSSGELEKLRAHQTNPLIVTNRDTPVSNLITLCIGPQGRKYRLAYGSEIRPFLPSHTWEFQPTALLCPPEINFITNAVHTGDPTLLDHRDGAIGGQNIALIANILVELRRADSADMHDWVDKHPNEPVPEDIRGRRLSRFQNAFQILMPNKRLAGLSEGQSPRIQFEEFGRKSAINQLSTGEKQIVFRGGHLLKYRGALGDAVVLVDEPELSLHPDWQKRIIPFFQEITRQPDGSHPQLVIATHSPFIVHGAADARVIILEKDDAGQVREAINPTFPASREAVAVAAFGLEGFIAAARRDQVVVLTEGESDAILINHAWEKLRPNQPTPFTPVPINGARTLNTMMQNAEAMVGAGGRVLGLFDYDQEGHGQWKGAWGTALPSTGSDATGLTKTHASGRARVMLLPVPSFRSNIAGQQLGSRSFMSIELLFRDQDLPSGMTEEIPLPGGVKIVTIKSHRKVDFANATKEFSAEQFASFEPILAAIVDLAS